MTLEEIDAIMHFNDGDHEKLDTEQSWQQVWCHHHQITSNIEPSTVRELCTLAKRGLAAMPESLPELSPEGFPEMSPKDFNVRMRLVALEHLIRERTETLEARIRDLELRSTSDE